MPLNYSKWNKLELSDDSDIEGHPNVDKKSLIRWKQRDIHEKREERKIRIAALNAEIACNDVLHPRLNAIAADLDIQGSPYFSSLVDQLRTNPSPDKPPSNAPNQPTYDAMLLNLLLQISEAAKVKAKEAKGDEKEALLVALQSGLAEHTSKLVAHQEKLKKDLEDELVEQKKNITSEDIHDGFDSKYVAPKAAPAPIKNAIIDGERAKITTKTKETTYEVLNPASTSAVDAENQEATVDDDGLPELTPALEGFSKIPLWSFEKSWEYIQGHRDVIVPGASDALLVAAFQAQSRAIPKYAKQCVHQSLLLQYGEKLGRDGVRVFFQKMINGDKRAIPVFAKDVEDTYNHLVSRVKATQEEIETEGGQEQIQLVAENPDTVISFNVPEGAPPADLRLEGPGTENMDIEEVRKILQARWDTFIAFPADFQAALKGGSLEEVNKVLGAMDVDTAEALVGQLDEVGILNFAEGGVRDETGLN